MKNNKNYVLSANIDEKMNAIVSKIKDEIRMDMYPIKDLLPIKIFSLFLFFRFPTKKSLLLTTTGFHRD